MSEYVWLESLVKFIKISWEDVSDGDVVYYQIISGRKDHSAHGPFIVVDRILGRLRNAQGVEFNFKSKVGPETIQLLKFDLVSLLMGDHA
jgi:hypothetical protein